MGRVRNCGYEEDQRTLDGGLVFLFFIVTNRSVVFYYSKVKGVAPCDALLGYNNNYLRSKNDVDLSPVEGLFRPSTEEETLILMYGEEPRRQNLYGALDELKTAYDAVTQSKVEGKIKKQIDLKCMQRNHMFTVQRKDR